MKHVKTFNELFESEEESTTVSIGPPRGRVIVEGTDVEKHKDKILAAIKEADPTSKADFYPVTGKIVGTMTTIYLRDLSVALRKIDGNLKAFIKK